MFDSNFFLNNDTISITITTLTKEGEILKKIVGLLTLATLVFIITGCSGQTKADYTTEEAETAINDGKDIEGKTVDVKVDKFIPDGTLGYTIWAGEHLNFISSENPKVKKGDHIIVKVTKVQNITGSYVINYEKE